MKKKLYFVIEKEISTDDETLTGNKTVSVYEIKDNVPTRFFEVEGDNEDSSSQLIQNYLDDNGFGDDDFELTQL